VQKNVTILAIFQNLCYNIFTETQKGTDIMNHTIKFHKPTGPAFAKDEIWVPCDGSNYSVRIMGVTKYVGVPAGAIHISDYRVTYRDDHGNVLEKDAWVFQTRYMHIADTNL